MHTMLFAASYIRRNPLLSLIIAVFIFSLIIAHEHHLLLTMYYHADLPTEKLRSDNIGINNNTSRKFPDDKIYGLIHIVKSGGTYVNQALANRFRGVCGNKGTSFHRYRFNEILLTNNTQQVSDATSKFWDIKAQDFAADNGFEECDYISLETSSWFWKKTFPGGKLHDTPIELHVPCRETVDHILSSCSWLNVSLDCNIPARELFEIMEKKCLIWSARYNHNLRQDFDVKCYDNDKTDEYVQFMSRLLQPRRFESRPFVYFRTRWGNRDKDNECIWSRQDLLNEMERYFLSGNNVSHHYYQFCNECLGSENDLTQ